MFVILFKECLDYLPSYGSLSNVELKINVIAFCILVIKKKKTLLEAIPKDMS